jgi:hypothetical protein
MDYIVIYSGILFGSGIAQWYSAELRDGLWRVRVPAGAGNFSHHRVQTRSGNHQPPIQCVPGPLSPGVKRPGSDADQ